MAKEQKPVKRDPTTRRGVTVLGFARLPKLLVQPGFLCCIASLDSALASRLKYVVRHPKVKVETVM